MGGGYYSQDVATQLRSTDRAYTWSTPPSAKAAPRTVHDALNPRGKTREVNNQTPIVIALDVTRSRGDDTKVFYKRLPEFMGLIELHGYVQGAGISFAAVGDADADKAPLQVSQFEADNRLDEALERFWIEEGGGGTGQESYELCAYFYSRTNCVRLARGEAGKGYFFFVGDEGFYPTLSQSAVKRLIGDNLGSDLPAAEAFRRLHEKFEVYLVFPKKSVEERKRDIDAEMRARVLSAGGQYDNVDIRASLLWNNRNDLDLHVIPPSGEKVYFGHKRSACGGWLDVDRNVMGDTDKPVENVQWSRGTAPKGRYRVRVNNYRFHSNPGDDTPFRVELEANGRIEHFDGVVPAGRVGYDADFPCFEFDYDPDAQRAEPVDHYAAYSDDVVLTQWATVIPRERILRVNDPKNIIEVVLGALAIGTGSRDLPAFLADLAERGLGAADVAQVESALTGLTPKNLGAVVSGEVPTGGASVGRTRRL